MHADRVYVSVRRIGGIMMKKIDIEIRDTKVSGNPFSS